MMGTERMLAKNLQVKSPQISDRRVAVANLLLRNVAEDEISVVGVKVPDA